MQTVAKDRGDAAAAACDKAISHWQSATTALKGSVSVNGFGIIHDRSAFRQ